MKILLIDDDPTDLKLFVQVLESAGVEIIQATNAEDGLARLKETKVDLVLVDILLPGMDGLAFARLVKSSPDFGNVPVVATSAVTAWPFQRLSQMAGCDGFVQKPIDTRNLARELQDVAKKNA